MVAPNRWLTAWVGATVLLSSLGARAIATHPAGDPGTGSVAVIATDDSTGSAIANVDVAVSRPGRYVRETHGELVWKASTDSVGYALLKGIPFDEYDLHFCSKLHEHALARGIQATEGRVDTVRVRLRYLGRPSDGPRCGVRYWVGPLQHTPSGKVTILASEKDTGRPVVFGTIFVIGDSRGAMTDEHGVATIAIPPGLTRLKIEALGRLPRTDTVRVIEGRRLTLHVRLERDSVQVPKP